MEERSILLREDFDIGAAALLLSGSNTARTSTSPSMGNLNTLTRDDWKWKEHLVSYLPIGHVDSRTHCSTQTFPGFGYLERTGVVRKTFASTSTDPSARASSGEVEDLFMAATDQLEEVHDEHLVPTDLPPSESFKSTTTSATRFLVDFYICLSPTFQVPVLYFTASYTSEFP